MPELTLALVDAVNAYVSYRIRKYVEDGPAEMRGEKDGLDLVMRNEAKLREAGWTVERLVGTRGSFRTWMSEHLSAQYVKNRFEVPSDRVKGYSREHGEDALFDELLRANEFDKGFTAEASVRLNRSTFSLGGACGVRPPLGGARPARRRRAKA